MNVPSQAHLLRGDVDGIALLQLNRPQTRNTLSEAMLTALAEAFTRSRTTRASAPWSFQPTARLSVPAMT